MPRRWPFDCAFKPATALPSESASPLSWPRRSATIAAHSVNTGARLISSVRSDMGDSSRVAVDGCGRERGHAHRDVLGAAGFGARVAHPLAGKGDDRLPGADID